MLDHQTVFVLVGLFALVVMAFAFAVRPFGRSSRYRRAPYGRIPGQVPIVGHRTALEIKTEQEREATRANALKRGIAPKPANGIPGASQPRREEA